MVQGENECSFGMVTIAGTGGRGERGEEQREALGDEVIGRLSWFPYKAPTIAL
jgi:hypothetical protein